MRWFAKKSSNHDEGVDLLVEFAGHSLTALLHHPLDAAVQHHLDHVVLWPEEVRLRAERETFRVGAKVSGDLAVLVKVRPVDELLQITPEPANPRLFSSPVSSSMVGIFANSPMRT